MLRLLSLLLIDEIVVISLYMQATARMVTRSTVEARTLDLTWWTLHWSMVC
jgi:hypothetical protein